MEIVTFDLVEDATLIDILAEERKTKEAKEARERAERVRLKKKYEEYLMSSFAVRVVPITIEPHPNADRLELAVVGGFRCVVGKGLYQTGDLVAYIPEQAIVPTEVARFLDIEGKLAGPEKNRVHPVKLRGFLSQGVTYPAKPEWVVGQDVTEELGITKHIPTIPEEMKGATWAAGHDRVVKYDIENWKAYPGVLEKGEKVVFTEKLHGVFCEVGILPPELAHPEWGSEILTSKGLADSGLSFQIVGKSALLRNAELDKADHAARQAARESALAAGVVTTSLALPPKVMRATDNYYLRAARGLHLFDKLRCFKPREGNVPVFMMGEVFGSGVQRKLHYGAQGAEDSTIGFRVFDVYVGHPKLGRYLNDDELDVFCDTLKLPRVPVLYRGPFSETVMMDHTVGRETITGRESHVREGIVMKPVIERVSPELGRVVLKSINPKYLTKTTGDEVG